MRKRYFATFILLTCLGTHAFATTIVVAVMPGGIVIGADGKTTPTGTTVKVFLLKHHLVVGDLYAQTAKSGDTGTVLYDFPSWAKQIDKNTSAKVSVSELATIINNQVTSTFAFAIQAIKSGQMTKDKALASGVDAYLIQYIVAGYEKGIPTVYSITLMPDWDTKTVNGPFKVLLNPEEGQNSNSHIFYRGRGVGIREAMATNSETQKELAARIPIEFRLLSTGKDLTLNQAANVVRAFLGIEAETEPSYVGFPITLVTIPKLGYGWIRTYKRDDRALSRLSDGKGSAENKH
jgi:hypothetical protein